VSTLVALESSRSPTPTEDEQEPVTASPNFSLYTAYARQICQHIRELADLVLERRKSYLLTSVNVYGHANFMTDDDRRQFDSDTGKDLFDC
jgi:homoserine kinase